MTGQSADFVRRQLKADLQRTPACISVERFGEELDARERQHLETCARCEAEFALWREFTASVAPQDEGAAVQWIVAETRRRRTERPARRVFSWGGGWLQLPPRAFAAAAAVVLAVSIGYVAWDREPDVATGGDIIYRAARLDVVAPVGDVETAPEQLIWMAVSGAVRYDIQVLEIDRTILWLGSSSTPRVDLPATVIAQLVPGKAILWEVTARDASGVALAQSGTQRFRVRVKTSTGAK